MQCRFKMEYMLFTIVRYNYRDYNIQVSPTFCQRSTDIDLDTLSRFPGICAFNV